jgi:hypothetical protein
VKRGKFYFGSQFQRFQNMVVWFQASDKAETSWRWGMVEESCLIRGSQEEKRINRKETGPRHIFNSMFQ